MTAHHFDIEDARLYGVNAAIILTNIRFWVEKNKANGKHFHDGNYWVYNSVSAFSELFPYMTERQIRFALDKLKDAGVIETANYNASTYDRTMWYAICQEREIHLTTMSDGNDTSVEPIPNNKPDSNPDSNHIGDLLSPIDVKPSFPELFETFWMEYPRRVSRGHAEKALRKALKSDSFDSIMDGLRLFTQAVEGKDKAFIPHAATWLNGERWKDRPDDIAPTPSHKHQGNFGMMDALIENERRRQSGQVHDGPRYIENPFTGEMEEVKT